VTTAKRLDELPDIPTVAETVPGYQANSWQGLVAPKKTPGEIVETLNKEISAALADSKIKERITDLGAEVLSGSPADFGQFIAAETAKWSKVIVAANIKLE
jgi:tripartite-type tricarboxylate transporter receptor subunit TctC